MKIVLALSLFLHTRLCFLKSLDKPEPAAPLNLIDDRFLHGMDLLHFDRSVFERDLKELGQSFKQCLLEKGIKKESFVGCVGGDYSKLGHNYRKLMDYMEIVLRKDFNLDLAPICNDRMGVVCDSLSEDLRDSLEQKKDPLPAMRVKARNLNLSEGQQSFVEGVLSKLESNYKDLLFCRKLMRVKRHAAVRNLVDFIKKLGVKTDYTYDFNPFALSKKTFHKLNRELMQKDLKGLSDKLTVLGSLRTKLRRA